MSASADDALSPYEHARLLRIARNREQLAALGLANAAAQLGAPAAAVPIAGARPAAPARAARTRGSRAAARLVQAAQQAWRVVRAAGASRG